MTSWFFLCKKRAPYIAIKDSSGLGPEVGYLYFGGEKMKKIKVCFLLCVGVTSIYGMDRLEKSDDCIPILITDEGDSSKKSSIRENIQKQCDVMVDAVVASVLKGRDEQTKHKVKTECNELLMQKKEQMASLIEREVESASEGGPDLSDETIEFLCPKDWLSPSKETSQLLGMVLVLGVALLVSDLVIDPALDKFFSGIRDAIEEWLLDHCE